MVCGAGISTIQDDWFVHVHRNGASFTCRRSMLPHISESSSGKDRLRAGNCSAFAGISSEWSGTGFSQTEHMKTDGARPFQVLCCSDRSHSPQASGYPDPCPKRNLGSLQILRSLCAVEINPYLMSWLQTRSEFHRNVHGALTGSQYLIVFPG